MNHFSMFGASLVVISLLDYYLVQLLVLLVFSQTTWLFKIHLFSSIFRLWFSQFDSFMEKLRLN